MEVQQVTRGKRIASMFLDHVIMSMIAVLFFIPEMIRSISDMESDDPTLNFGLKYPLIAAIGLVLYLCKDCINGRSIGKRIIKLQVVDHRTNLPANPLRCLVRNIFIIVWVIEVVFFLIDGKRRLGDYVAGTRVVLFDPTLKQAKPKILQTLLAFAIAYGIIASLFTLIPTVVSGKSAFPISSSYNATESRAVENIYIQSLSAYLTPEVHVYDRIKNDTLGLKYVYADFNLKNDFISSSKDFIDLKNSTIQLLTSMYPDKTFVGRLHYSYNGNGKFHSMFVNLDWR